MNVKRSTCNAQLSRLGASEKEAAVATVMADEEELETCVSAKRTRIGDTKLRAEVTGRQGVMATNPISTFGFVFPVSVGWRESGRMTTEICRQTTDGPGRFRQAQDDKWKNRAELKSLLSKHDYKGTSLLVGEDAAGFVEEDAAEVHLEGFGVGGFDEGFFFGNQFGFDELEERLVEGLHAFVGAGLDGGEKFVEAVLFDEFADGAGVEHDLDGGNDAAGGRRHEPLADDTAQGGGHLTANLVAFVRGEEIEGAADGGVGRGRVQGGQHKMARVRGGEGGHERLAVAHFADDDDVGILAHDVDEGAFEAERIEADLALFDDRLLVLEHVLDRVFERDDVALLGFVDMLDHRRERAGLAATRGAGDEDDAALGAGNFAELFRQVQIMEGRHGRFDVAHHESGQAALVENIHAEAAESGVDVRKVSFLLTVEAGLEMFREDETDDFRDLLGGGRIDLHGEQFARDADGGVVAGLHMNVRSRHVDGELQQTVKVFHTVSGRSRY